MIARINQIVPATGWYALYGGHARGLEKNIEVVQALCPVVVFALVENEEGDQSVIGLTADYGSVSLALEDDVGNFLRYIYSPDRVLDREGANLTDIL